MNVSFQIRGLKDEFFDEESNGAVSPKSTPFREGLMQAPPVTRMSLLTGTSYLPREQILAMIPPRKVVDRHVAHFFNVYDLALGKL